MSSNTFSNTNTGDKPEDPYKAKNLDTAATTKEKIDDLAKFMDSCKFGMMTTRDSTTSYLHSRCMALAAKETGGIDLLFHTNTESGKTDELASDPHINISFINTSGEWASISGKASIETDRSLVRKYYSQDLKAWVGDLGDGKHDGSAEDPRIGIIRVKMHSAVYSVVNKNFISRAADIAQGAVTGKAPTIQKLREISEDEVLTWRKAN
ncbi:BLI-3 blue-light-inducible Bli-3 protein [Pyricularia grisea]|uniref:General stress protein FMN-binding split barrel domain-containing protein n=1 Tax=Pyricularia grisea TaxID=148305 RepID=A0A6P8B9W2_PYRGI|nr:uncharacterized protein PgNI_05024 [Pyricularia grisea]KAI6356290.1 BLI-3 blue-light-inducible Bli-3 protein [Pyricularia grisea]TLD12462.1 hypothetical protein PgNI_05024 [Pyricularia grisea]